MCAGTREPARADQSQRWALLSSSVPGLAGRTQNSSPAGSRMIHQECACRTNSAPSFSSLAISAAGSSVWMSRCTRPVVEPLDQQPQLLAGQRCSVVLGVAVKPGQRLAGGRAPKRQLTVMVGRRNVNHDLEQPAVVRHPASLRALTAASAPAQEPANRTRGAAESDSAQPDGCDIGAGIR